MFQARLQPSLREAPYQHSNLDEAEVYRFSAHGSRDRKVT